MDHTMHDHRGPFSNWLAKNNQMGRSGWTYYWSRQENGYTNQLNIKTEMHRVLRKILSAMENGELAASKDLEVRSRGKKDE